MKIIVDINHPAHVHYFKNFIWEMERKGYELLIIASEKDIALKLLDNYGFEYVKLGRIYGKSLFEKLTNLPLIELKMYNAVKGFKPDIFLGFGSIRAAHVSYILRKKCILFEDTENSMEQIRLYLPFVNAICTPSCFKKNLGKKQIWYKGYTELAHLHPNYFTPNPAVLDEIGLCKNDSYIIFRFVSWNATHDIGQYGIRNKIEMVQKLKKYVQQVFISSEGKLNKKLEKYRLKISPEKFHDLLYYATLYIGEGGTPTTESAILGTHAICVNTLRAGTINEVEKRYNLVHHFSDKKKMEKQALNTALRLLKNKNLKQEGKRKREKLLRDKIDVTKFMIWFLENYPESFQKMKENPKLQDRFKNY